MGIWTDQYLKWNDSHSLVNPHDAMFNDNVVTRMELLTWAFNNATNLHNSSEKIKFAILLYQMYNNNYTKSPQQFIKDAQKTLGIDLT